MKVIRLAEQNMEEALHRSVAILLSGGIVAYPTETFYGLGAKFDMEDTLKRLYAIKRRRKEKAMPLIIGYKRQLSVLTKYTNDAAMPLMERYWPGPLTLLFPAKENLSRFITAGTSKVAVRIPGESFALDLAKLADFPITATSANISGMPPAQDADTVAKYFSSKIDLIIDGGHTPGGLPSTIVDITGKEIRLLRDGAIKINGSRGVRL